MVVVAIGGFSTKTVEGCGFAVHVVVFCGSDLWFGSISGCMMICFLYEGQGEFGYPWMLCFLYFTLSLAFCPCP